MIRLYREEKSAQADGIEAEFREMVLGFDCMVVDTSRAVNLFVADVTLPVITDNQRIISGDEIPVYIKETEKFMREWQLLQNHCCTTADIELD